jgi:hypothetical protein
MFESVEFWELVAAIVIGGFAFHVINIVGGMVWAFLFGK